MSEIIVILSIAASIIIGAVIGFIIRFKQYTQEAAKEKFAIAESALSAIKDSLYKFIVEAEKAWGKNTGSVKKSYVIGLVINSQFYISLPNYIKIIVNSITIGALIDEMVDKILKPAMENNKDLQNKLVE